VQVLRELGWPLSEEEVIERFVGRSDRDTEAVSYTRKLWMRVKRKAAYLPGC
jgi:hypothetical protein